jgi:hypothetical protein
MMLNLSIEVSQTESEYLARVARAFQLTPEQLMSQVTTRLIQEGMKNPMGSIAIMGNAAGKNPFEVVQCQARFMAGR